MSKRAVFVFSFLFAALAALLATNDARAMPITSNTVTWSAGDFPLPVAGGGVRLAENGLTLVLSALDGTYHSPVLEAPGPFNVVVPQWIAELPAGTELDLWLRTAPAGGEWGDWYSIVENDDWTLPEDPDTVGNMVAVPESDGTHTRFEVAIELRRMVSAPIPILNELRFTFIDSTAGPTSAELAALAKSAGTDGDGYPKPPVVGRDVWCTDPACNYSDGLEYVPVTHLIVHHTVSSNSSSDWAAIVRAIWYFHTFTRGWGDIGYNYLVDMNGVLYEGHLGGDDVVGTHASGANAGSMALSFIGTFTTPSQNPPGIEPPPAMRNAAIELFSWKADQKNIDVFSASRLPNLSWGLNHMMGHRDVYGTTTCPGDQAHVLIPTIRDAVAANIGQVPLHTYYDELTPIFNMSNANWHDGPAGCGFNTHSYYTYSVTDPAESTNWATWTPDLPAAGRYQVEVLAPFCNIGGPDTQGARYEVHHANGTTTVQINQSANLGVWVSVGEFDFLAGTSGYIYLSDLTNTDESKAVWYDAIRFRPVTSPPAVTNSSPPHYAWLNSRTVDFAWQIVNPGTIASARLVVATEASFSNILLDTPVGGSTYTHTFSQDYVNLYWRIVLTANDGTTYASTPTLFGIDTTAPVSSVASVFALGNGAYLLTWEATESGSGVQGFKVDYRASGVSSWSPWLNNHAGNGGLFVPPDQNQAYEFRVRAVDNVGNTEPLHTAPDGTTDGAPLLDHAIMVPITNR